MNEHYICFACEKEFDIRSEDKYCPYCGASVSYSFSRQYFELSKKNIELIEKEKETKAELLEWSKKMQHNYKLLVNYELKIDKIRGKIKEISSDIDLDNSELQSVAQKLYISRLRMDKYIQILGIDFIRDKNYFTCENKNVSEIYNEYITLDSQEREKYDGILNFNDIVLKKDFSIFRSVNQDNNKNVLHLAEEDGLFYGFPGPYLYENQFGVSNSQIFNDTFDLEIEYIEEKEFAKRKIKARIEPIVFRKYDRMCFTMEKKGKIILFRAKKSIENTTEQ